mmetsp:Transcript_28568/g.31734  ORF Transcript_28568/g.31734 Transcript_28568/m.31734 type:complete len:260 (-) Transcript_28568:28-807(-)
METEEGVSLVSFWFRLCDIVSFDQLLVLGTTCWTLNAFSNTKSILVSKYNQAASKRRFWPKCPISDSSNEPLEHQILQLKKTMLKKESDLFVENHLQAKKIVPHYNKNEELLRLYDGLKNIKQDMVGTKIKLTVEEYQSLYTLSYNLVKDYFRPAMYRLTCMVIQERFNEIKKQVEDGRKEGYLSKNSCVNLKNKFAAYGKTIGRIGRVIERGYCDMDRPKFETIAANLIETLAIQADNAESEAPHEPSFQKTKACLKQ